MFIYTLFKHHTVRCRESVIILEAYLWQWNIPKHSLITCHWICNEVSWRPSVSKSTKLWITRIFRDVVNFLYSIRAVHGSRTDQVARKLWKVCKSVCNFRHIDPGDTTFDEKFVKSIVLLYFSLTVIRSPSSFKRTYLARWNDFRRLPGVNFTRVRHSNCHCLVVSKVIRSLSKSKYFLFSALQWHVRNKSMFVTRTKLEIDIKSWKHFRVT